MFVKMTITTNPEIVREESKVSERNKREKFMENHDRCHRTCSIHLKTKSKLLYRGALKIFISLFHTNTAIKVITCKMFLMTQHNHL